MGGAILRAACKMLNPKEILITDKDAAKVKELTGELGCLDASDNITAAKKADFVILCVKPQNIETVMRDISSVLAQREVEGNPAVLVSIAAGISIDKLRSYVSKTQPIIRVMPNTPALIGKGLMIIADDGSAAHDKIAVLENMLKGCGETMRLSESLMDQATVAASCSPAFVYIFIEALADAGVMKGLTRTDAIKMAASAAMGAAAMVMETGKGPSELKDMVCSPAGSTICGVAALEEAGFRSAVIKAFKAAYDRNIEMGK